MQVGVGWDGAVVLDDREDEPAEGGGERRKGIVDTRVFVDREEGRPVEDAAGGVVEGGRAGTRGRQAEADDEEEESGGGGVAAHAFGWLVVVGGGTAGVPVWREGRGGRGGGSECWGW